MRLSLKRAVVLGGLALSLGGCGIPLSRSAQAISSANLPAELNGGAPTSTTTSTTVPPVPSHASHLEVYLVAHSGTHLVAVRRYWEQKVTPLIALGLLIQGPDLSDAKRGIQTDLATTDHVEVSVSKAGLAEVTLGSSFDDLFGTSLYVPLAQIVFTLMVNFPYIKGVNFYLAGELFNYTPSGSSSPRPVTERTYALLAPLRHH